MHYHLNADVPISLGTVQGMQNRSYALLGQAPPNAYTARLIECSCQSRFNGSYPGDVIVVADPMKVRLGQNFGVSLVLGIALTRDVLWARCGPGHGDDVTSTVYGALFQYAHRSEEIVSGSGGVPGVLIYTISDWQRGSGVVLARKIYDRDGACEPTPGQPCVAHEHTVLELRRAAPQQNLAPALAR
jgi:hypothetical protein